ncbi:hypothetical protein GJV76_10550 [Myroides sp. BIT-d1]|uniref:Uncharacterized protein n=1 Tax=Myroides albus TaxID=2562892 RepID=A0A6I3LGE0_9FLAO|nr:heparinase II/III family protein [Myroides albus]MTG98559.1 hypothetical protein [Myroides albus]
MKFLIKIKHILFVIPRIGVYNFFYILYYSFSLKVGIHKRKFNLGPFVVTTDFFSNVSFEKVKSNLTQEEKELIVHKANGVIENYFQFYNYWFFYIPENKYWFFDPFSKKSLDSLDKHWCEINEFDLNTGDIKNLWELSRFDWVLSLTKAYCLTNDEAYLLKLNALLKDWCTHNPYNQGIHWKCGQEASIRVMKLYNASLLLKTLYEVNEGLFDFVFKHIERINGNINYAIAQNNNHGTSEAAVLYIGSIWLLKQENSTLLTNQTKKRLIEYKSRGRKILENRIQKLILHDGTFSQKSVNYHRVVMDTISFVLYGMQEFKEPEFSAAILLKLDKLGMWLLDLVSNDKGEVPNLGSNDGAMFEQLHELDYRDFRPSIQLFFGLLHQQIIWDSRDVLAPLIWRNIDMSQFKRNYEVINKCDVKDSEFVQLVYKNLKTLVVAKQDNFRPSNDILHLDVFYKGVNIMLDTGSYSYNALETNYFKSIRAHNTIQFGSSEPMPKISRFLNGEWVKVVSGIIAENDNQISWEGFYRDYKKNQHKRKIYIDKRNPELTVVDIFKSSSKGQKVCLNFHLINDYENYLDLTCSDQNGNNIEALVHKGEHSLYYMNKKKHVIASYISTESEGTFTTTLKFK